MKNAGYQDEGFLDRGALDEELTRVFDRCQDCRRCLPLCPSFPSLFESLDRHDQKATEMTAQERREVVDLCFECKLCYNHCPYHPPHEWQLDFPKLMTRAKLVQAKEDGIPFHERMGQRQDLLGKSACLAAPITNALYKNKAARVLLEKVTGIDRRFTMPTYSSRPLSKELKGSAGGEAENGRVVLFGTCFVEYSDAEAGRAARAVLTHNQVAVEYAYETCCGAPYLHGGDFEGARKSAENIVRQLAGPAREGIPIVVPGPTCSYQLKKEIPELIDSDDARAVGEVTLDLGEYLFKLAASKKLDREFSVALGRVAYHLPCHLKSQNIGFRSMQLLKLAGAEVEMLDHCSGVDGTWGMKAKNYDESLKVAGPLLESVDRQKADHVATDCPLSALRIEEGTGRRAVHPVVLLARAYGLGEQPS